MKKSKDAQPYADALAELQRILQNLQEEKIGIDDLAAQIARANELIQICRERLRLAEGELEKLGA